MKPFYIRKIGASIVVTDALLDREEEMGAAFMDKKCAFLNSALKGKYPDHAIVWTRYWNEEDRTLYYNLDIEEQHPGNVIGRTNFKAGVFV